MPFESLKFAPYNSFADTSFFHELAQLKLDDLKLDESQVPLVGSYEPGNGVLSVSKSSFYKSSNKDSRNSTKSDNTTDTKKYSNLPVSKSCFAPGTLLALNTIESFKIYDRSKLLREKQQSICDAISSGAVLEDPSLLAAFQVLVFCDLKKYTCVFWFAFPAPLVDWKAEEVEEIDEEVEKENRKENAKDMVIAIEEWKKSVDVSQWGFFLVKQEFKDCEEKWQVSSLKNYESFFDTSSSKNKQYLAFTDISSHKSVPGWSLRNYLLFAFHFNLFERFPNLNVLSYRGPGPHTSYVIKGISTSSTKSDLEQLIHQVPKAFGWERLASTGKPSPKYIELGTLIDPKKLADQAVDLNLKLMKWRVAPDLDLGIVKNTKCLLLGAGTLGSYIARGLLGWGVRSITFVDSGRVSYSNPVRQPLYTFEDCKDGGRDKAECAAEALKTIYPSVESQGVKLEIAMAGHGVYDEETQQKEYEKLVELIKEHDVVFLLMDSREARWLPTVMCAGLGKLVLNVALGFDSFVVMRHGLIEPDSGTVPHLGCYFCNDIVAPLDSTTNRTLDQMCTVTRPGVAMLASANAVELLVSLLQNPLKGLAPPETDKDSTNESGVSSYYVPHQLRGFLNSFSTIAVHGPAYPHCSACSIPVRNAWLERGWDFVKDALNNPKYLEDLSGLTEVQKLAEEMEKELDIGTSDDEWEIN